MDITTYASPEDRERILEFLETHSLEANAWLIWSVFGALSGRESVEKVIVCHRNGIITGAARLADVSAYNSTSKPEYDYQIDIDALDEQAAEALIQFMPDGKRHYIVTYGSSVQSYIDQLPGIKRWTGCLYFTVSPDTFTPVPSPEVVELTEVDDALFEGCEDRPSWENAWEGRQIYAILREGRVAAHLSTGVLAPEVTTKRHVAPICGVYTQTPWRRMGFGKQLVSHVTELILQVGNAPLYWTDADNIASQGLCKGLGYHQYALNVRYIWQKVR